MLKRFCIIASYPAFLLAARFIPFDRLPSTCAFYRTTGYPCPSCGLTRSAMALAHLDFDRAMQMNPLGFVFVGVFALWWAVSVYEIAAGRRTRLRAWVGRRISLLTLIGIGMLLVFGALRIACLISQ